MQRSFPICWALAARGVAEAAHIPPRMKAGASSAHSKRCAWFGWASSQCRASVWSAPGLPALSQAERRGQAGRRGLGFATVGLFENGRGPRALQDLTEVRLHDRNEHNAGKPHRRNSENVSNTMSARGGPASPQRHEEAERGFVGILCASSCLCGNSIIGFPSFARRTSFGCRPSGFRLCRRLATVVLGFSAWLTGRAGIPYSSPQATSTNELNVRNLSRL